MSLWPRALDLIVWLAIFDSYLIYLRYYYIIVDFVHTYKLVTSDKEIKLSNLLILLLQTPPVKGPTAPCSRHRGGLPFSTTESTNIRASLNYNRVPRLGLNRLSRAKPDRSQPMEIGIQEDPVRANRIHFVG